jgi:hypothetical protein
MGKLTCSLSDALAAMIGVVWMASTTEVLEEPGMIWMRV